MLYDPQRESVSGYRDTDGRVPQDPQDGRTKKAGDTIRKKAYSWLQIQNWGHSGIHCEHLPAEVSRETFAIYAVQSEDGV